MGNMYLDNTFSDNQFIATYLTHPLRSSISQLADMVQKAPSLCCLKDMATRKYLLTNKFETELTGLEPDELVGLTVDDLDCSFYNGGKEAFVNTIARLDHEINVKQHTVFHKELYLTYQGFVQLRHLIRTPVIGQNNNKTLAVCYCIEDLTARCNAFDLFKLYQKYYLPKAAIEKFLGYLEVDTDFREMPTNTEVRVLIAMLRNPHHKQVARLLQVSHKTVAHHVYLLKSKLQVGKTLDDILEKMCDKWVPIVNGYRYY